MRPRLAHLKKKFQDSVSYKLHRNNGLWLFKNSQVTDNIQHPFQCIVVALVC